MLFYCKRLQLKVKTEDTLIMEESRRHTCTCVIGRKERGGEREREGERDRFTDRLVIGQSESEDI